jgi:hypothetical protein
VEDQEVWEARFGVPVRLYEEDDKNGGGVGTGKTKDLKKKGRPHYRSPVFGGSEPSSSSSEGSSSDEPDLHMPGAAPPYSMHQTPRRHKTVYDIPVRGSKDAPKTFTGKYNEVRLFIDHFERLIKKCRISSDSDRCDLLMLYCSTDVQNIIRTLDGYEYRKWGVLRPQLLKFFDVDRVYQKYKLIDVKTYAARKRLQTCYNLTQWRRYFLKFNTIAGGPLSKAHLNREDYNSYFLLGINPMLRQVLENRILQVNPRCDDDDQYTVAEINEAAEWHFRWNKYETLMVRAAVLGEERDEDYSGEDSEEDSSDVSSESDLRASGRSDASTRRRRKINKRRRL